VLPFAVRGAAFHPDALREWQQLTARGRAQFKQKLAERLVVPRIPASRLLGTSDRTTIKIRSAGFRLVYELRDREVLVVAVGKRGRSAVYRQADQR
jgi:mRNA interferase RelE/StbE